LPEQHGFSLISSAREFRTKPAPVAHSKFRVLCEI
jgi:hypothetical protein